MRLRRRADFWTTVILLEGLALFCVTFSDAMSGYGYVAGFLLGALALSLRLRAARERTFLRTAKRIPAQILSVTPIKPRMTNRAVQAEVEFRYWPEGGAPREQRTTVDLRRFGRLFRGESTTAFMDPSVSNRVALESELTYHRADHERRR